MPSTHHQPARKVDPAKRATAPGQRAAKPETPLSISPGGMTPARVLRLQSVVGNRATQRLLAQPPPASRTLMGSAPLIQRYEAGEHIKFGDVESLIGQEEKKHAVAGAPSTYVVKDREMPPAIATRFGISVDFLLARNAGLYRTWISDTGKKIHGFNRGAEIVLPGQTVAEVATALGVPEKTVRDLNSASLKSWTVPQSSKQIEGFDRGTTVTATNGRMAVGGVGAPPAGKTSMKNVTINGVDFSYGEVIALGDLYESPEKMYAASVTELRALKALLGRDAAAPGSVTTKEWQDATGGRYVKLAEGNITHFGPSNAALTAATSTSGKNHKTEWEKYHKQALEKAQAGDKDNALGINAFADHFLTDAFASGHLINKEDVMSRFDAAFDKKAQVAFFDAVAAGAWSNAAVSGLLSQYETVEWKGGFFRPNINSASRFSSLLQGIYEDPSGKGTILSAVAKVVHDELNKGGVDVENDNGDHWTATGDASMNADSLNYGKLAVAQSQVNVMNAVSAKVALDFTALFAAAWKYTPKPTVGGTKVIHDTIDRLTNPAGADTRKAAADIIVREIPAIVDELVARKKLKKA